MSVAAGGREGLRMFGCWVEVGVADWGEGGREDVEGAAKLQLHVYVRN
jgi:hypothetical protein